jgi:CheY-like chemotaxis protein
MRSLESKPRASLVAPAEGRNHEAAVTGQETPRAEVACAVTLPDGRSPGQPSNIARSFAADSWPGLCSGVIAMSPLLRHRILIVEEEPNLRRALRSTLTDGAYDVGECGDTDVALLLHERHRFDAVLFECHAPPRRPEAFVSSLRAADPDLLILACCASADPERRRTLLAAGVDAFLAKVDLYRELMPMLSGHLKAADEDASPP